MAILAGQGTSGAADANLSGGGSIGRDFFDTVNVCTSAGTIETLSVVVGGAPTIKVKVWRDDGTNFVFVGSSTLSAALTAGLNSDVPLSSPIAVLTGDIVSLHIGNTGTLTATDTTPDAILWSGGSSDETATITKASRGSSIPRYLNFTANGTPSAGGTIYGIQFNDSGDVVVPIWSSGASSAFSLDADFTTGSLTNVDSLLGIVSGSSPNHHFTIFSDGHYVFKASGTALVNSPAGIFSANTRYKLSINRTGTDSLVVTIYAEDGTTVVDTNSLTSTANFNIDRVGSSATPALPFSGIVWSLALVGGTQNRTYQSTVNTGTTWTDTEAGAQNGTLTGLDASPWVADAVASNAITIAEAGYSNRVYQRDTETTATVNFNVTYSGTPSGLQYRLLNAADDTTEIITWTTFDASPAGGTSTLTFNAPVSRTAYHVQVRHLDDPATTAIQTGDWWAGAIVWMGGQSLSEEMSTSGAITPQTGHFRFTGTNAVSPTAGAGSKALADALIGAEDMAVLIINNAVSATALTLEAGDANYWNDPSGVRWTNSVDDVLAATGDNRIEFAWWHQGTRDSLNNVSTAVYESALGEFFTRVRASFTARDGGALKVISAIIGRDTRGGNSTDSRRQATRNAQLSYSSTDVNFYPVETYYMATKDGVHGTNEAYVKLAGEAVAAYYAAKGDIAVSAPKLSLATVGAANNEIDLVYNANLLATDSAYSTEGVRVELDGSPLTVSSFTRKNNTTATVTLSAPISAGTLTAYVGYGVGSSMAELVYPRSEAAVLPVSGGSHNLTALSVNAEPVTISSTINITATNTPDGTYPTLIFNPPDYSVIHSGNVTFTAGAASIPTIPLAIGTAWRGVVFDNNATPIDGAAIVGVTE